jgi:Flp pilus assembly protein TadB
MNTLFLIPVVAVIAVFTFVAIATWSDNRRKEREAFYRHETYRKMLEQPQGSAEQILQLMRQEELQKNRRRIEGIRLSGMITLVSGAGLMMFLYFLVKDEPVYWVGVIPALVGLVLLAYGYFLAPKPSDPGDMPG